MRYALHQAAVAGKHPGPVIDQRQPRPVELGGEHLLRERHADGVREPLAQRAGRGLDAHGEIVLRVSCAATAELAEMPDLVHADRIAGQVQQRIQQHRGVAIGQHEAIAVPPARIGRIVLQEFPPQHFGEVRHAHRRPGVARVGLLYRIHREHTDHVGELSARGHGWLTDRGTAGMAGAHCLTAGRGRAISTAFARIGRRAAGYGPRATGYGLRAEAVGRGPGAGAGERSEATRPEQPDPAGLCMVRTVVSAIRCGQPAGLEFR